MPYDDETIARKCHTRRSDIEDLLRHLAVFDKLLPRNIEIRLESQEEAEVYNAIKGELYPEMRIIFICDKPSGPEV